MEKHYWKFSSEGHKTFAAYGSSKQANEMWKFLRTKGKDFEFHEMTECDVALLKRHETVDLENFFTLTSLDHRA